jgi:hypothetical protein
MQERERNARRRRLPTTRAASWAAVTVAATFTLAAAGPVRGQAPQPSCGGILATVPGATEANDVLFGTPGDDVIAGLGGNDQIFGREGNDRICGDTGEDQLFGEAGDDAIDGGPDLDFVSGGPGNDVMTGGGDGFDVVVFRNAPGRVEVDLGAGTAIGDGNDRFTAFDAVRGSLFDDLLLGDDSTDYFFGDAGNDVIRGQGGTDAVLFLGSVKADLAAGPGPGNGVAEGEGRDVLQSIENLGGSVFADELRGDPGDNLILGFHERDVIAGGGGRDRLLGDNGPDEVSGGPGNDSLSGGAGDDVLSGGAGSEDTVTYDESSGRVRVDLAAGRVRGEGSDTVRGFEAVLGSEGDDVLDGDVGSNSLTGGGGADKLFGRAGDDFLKGGSGRDEADGGPGRDFCIESERSRHCEPSRRLAALDARAASEDALGDALSRLQRAGTRFDSLLAPDFIASVSPLETLRRLAQPRPEDAVVYETAAPKCSRSRGRNVITIAPPERVKALTSTDKTVYWSATLRHYVGRGPGRVVMRAETAEADLETGLTNRGLPDWHLGDDAKNPYRPIRAVVGRGLYAWTARVTWSYSGNPLGVRRVRPHWQNRQPGDSCFFPRP